MQLAVKSRICFVAIALLLCSPNTSGQELTDSVAVQTTVVGDSISSVAVFSLDSVIYENDGTDIGSDIIFLSDTAELAITYPLDNTSVHFKHSPAKATIMSAVLPGLGQAYNRKYWKIPIVYIAVGISVNRFLKFQNEYSRWRRAYIDYFDGDPHTNYWETIYNFSPTADIPNVITKGKDRYRTWRDWSIVAVVAAYALNIIDANVDAHLMDFSLDDDISLNIHPCFLENGMNSRKIGLTLHFTF